MSQVSVIPSEYTKVTKLISLGTNTLFPYINTGVIPTSDYGFDVVCETYSVFGTGSNFGCIFGGRYTSGNLDFQVTTFSEYSMQGTLRWGFSSIQGGLAANQKMRIVLKNRKYSVDGVEIRTITDNATGNRVIYLFGLNNGGTPVQHGLGCAIYNAKFYDNNGELIRDYVPVVRNADNKPGLYDTVEKQFLTNSSTTSVEFTWE